MAGTNMTTNTITYNNAVRQLEMKYSDYVKVCQYLYLNCNDKDYHTAMVKLDKFKITME